jgi:hypothetical protein
VKSAALDHQPAEPAPASDAPAVIHLPRLPRPKKKPKRQRSRMAFIRLDDAEFAELETRAREAGLSVGAYCRACSLGDAGPRARRRVTVERELLARNTAALAEKFIKQYLPRLRSARAAEAPIRRELIPVLGDKPMEGVAARGAEHPGRARPKSGGEHAARHAQASRKIFNWALSRDSEGLEGNPCDRIKAAELHGAPRRAIMC